MSDPEKAEPPPAKPETVPIPYAASGRGLHDQLYSLPATRQPSPELHTALAAGLARERLRKFRAVYDGNTAAAVVLHQFDQALAAGLVLLLSTTELLMRQAMHAQLTGLFGDRWFDQTAPFDYRTKTAIKMSKQQLGGPNQVAAMPPGKVIAGFSLGTWCNLVARGGAPVKNSHQPPLDYESTLWNPALQHAFPNWTGGRADFDALLREVRYARNRVAHHEPVVFGVPLVGVYENHRKVRLKVGTAVERILTLLEAVNLDAGRQLRATAAAWPVLSDSLIADAEGAVQAGSILR